MRAYVITEDELLDLTNRLEPALDRVEKTELHYTAGRMKGAVNFLVQLFDQPGRGLQL